MLNIFKKKKKQEEKPEASESDSFQAAEPAPPETPTKPLPKPSAKEVSHYQNELLLRGKIGMSTGSPEEKKPEKPKEDSHSDKIDSEQAQVIKININKKLDNQE